MKRATGFTLIEVLLASVLTAVLIAALWNLLSTYVRLFETGHAKTEQSQLARTLVRQFESDLRAALPVMRPDRRTKTARASGAVSRQTASLRGTRDRLELVVREAAAPISDASSMDGARTERSVAAAPRVPELRKVVYSFVESADGRRVDPRSPPGLARYEIPWESDRASGLAARPARPATSARREVDAGDSAAALDIENADDDAMDHALSQTAQPADDAQWHAPEVERMSLRYFDGSAWSDDWDSLARQALPLAVEVTLQVRAFDAPRRAGHAASDPRDSRPMTANTDDPRRPIYRLVTYLAGGAQVTATKRGQAAVRGSAAQATQSVSP